MQSKRLRGPAIVICNHTSVFDYVIVLFTFFSRTVRCMMAEVLFSKSKGILPKYLTWLGGVFVNRNTKDFSFLSECLDILDKGGLVCVFPESRIPKPGEETPLPFSDTVAYLAHQSGAPVIPLFTNGVYFSPLKRARVIIGKPLFAKDVWDENRSTKENIAALTAYFRDNTVKLGKQLKTHIENDRQKNHKSYLVFDFAKVTAAIPLWLWYRPKRIYISDAAASHHKKGVVFIANHIGPTDPVVMMLGIWYRRLHILAMRELFERPIMGMFMRSFHAIYVDRENFRYGSFRRIVALLKEGKAVALFPEGHIGESDDTVAAFKTGFIMMASTANAPIVPMYIKKKKSFWERQIIVIGEPLTVGTGDGKMPSMKQADMLAGLLRQKELELIHYA